MRRADGGTDLESSGVRVQQVCLSVGVEERVVLVLAVERDEIAPELAKLARGRGPSVDPGGALLANLPLENQPRAPRLEDAFDAGAVGPVAHLIRPASSAQHQAQR